MDPNAVNQGTRIWGKQKQALFKAEYKNMSKGDQRQSSKKKKQKQTNKKKQQDKIVTKKQYNKVQGKGKSTNQTWKTQNQNIQGDWKQAGR